MEPRINTAYDREGRRKYLSRTEGQKFLAKAAQLPRLEALFCLTLYYTGCRISEALNLRSCDLDADLHAVLFRTLKKRHQKTSRRIPLPVFLARELLKLAAPQRNRRLWSFSRTTGWRIVKGVMKDASISGIHATSKGLRHGFGVRGALGHVPLSLIRHWMGHADSATTAIYLAVRDDEERALIRKTW